MSVPDILKRIVRHKRGEVTLARGELDRWRKRVREAPPPLDFAAALSRPDTAIIAEVKKASPSAGVIVSDFDPARIATAYAEAGVDAVSVLTERKFFQGSPEDFLAVRGAVPKLPILRKDFIIEPAQIHETRALGADSFLLIAAILSEVELVDFIALGRELGMEPLVEIHDEAELAKALHAESAIIGVNNRDLRTFEVSLETAAALRPLIPEGIITVAESGVKSAADAAFLRRAGYDALLVGQHLMEAGTTGAGAGVAELKSSNQNNRESS